MEYSFGEEWVSTMRNDERLWSCLDRARRGSGFPSQLPAPFSAAVKDRYCWDSSVVTWAARNRMSWMRALLITLPELFMKQSQEQCGPWWVFGFCFVLPFVLGRIHYFQIFLELQGFWCAVSLWPVADLGSGSDFFSSLRGYFFSSSLSPPPLPSSPLPRLSSNSFIHLFNHFGHRISLCRPDWLQTQSFCQAPECCYKCETPYLVSCQFICSLVICA